jgi:hypothetical protein
MHGSSEGHSGYIYKRTQPSCRNSGRAATRMNTTTLCDPIFHDAYELVKSGFEPLYKAISDRVQKELYGSRATRAQKIIHCVDS